MVLQFVYQNHHKINSLFAILLKLLIIRVSIKTMYQQKTTALIHLLNQLVLDKPQAINLAVSCVLAGGHLLLQDLPGMGKTTLAHALANGLGLPFNRVQFTSDMLPADIVGMMIYNQATHEFEFRKGAVFTQLLLADEINRSSPKTQSALLEAMEEYQVTMDGKTYPLPTPFFVIATQNPAQQSGVYPLPESQLDRFLMCVSMGYPSKQAERELLEGIDRRKFVADMHAIITPNELMQAMKDVSNLYVAPVVLDYLQALVEKSRQNERYHGLSPRGVLALKRASQAYAYVMGQDSVAIDDVAAVFPAVANHRLGQTFDVHSHTNTLAHQILANVSTL